MEGKFDLKLIENLGCLSFPLSKANSLKIIVNANSDTEYNVNILLPGNRKIFFYILNLNTLKRCSKLDFVETSTSNEKYKGSNLSFLKALNFPVTISDFHFSSKNLLAIGKDVLCFIKLKDHFLYGNIQQNDEPMEISVEDEKFKQSDFESVVKLSELEKHQYENIHIFQIQDFLDDGFIVCYKNNETLMWCVALVTETFYTNGDDHKSTFIQLFNFPLSYTKDYTNQMNQPQILFYDSNHIFWNKVFTFEQKLYSNCVLLVGHSEGKMLYALCSWSKQTKELNLITPLEELCDINQPLLSINFVENFEKIEGSGALIILGQKGYLCLITPNQVCKNSTIIKKGLFWITSIELSTPVQNYIILSDCIIYSSEKGDVWITKFIPDDSVVKHKNKYLKLVTQATDFCEVVLISLINKAKGIFLMVTKTGNLYLMQYCTEENAVTVKKSLPSLMNGILQQSLTLKNIISIKQSQSKFFAAVSTFASIKFDAGASFTLNCEMKEIEGDIKKILVDLNFQNLEEFNLDSEFWFITASIYNPCEIQSAVISKTKPLSSGSTLCIEIQESNICSFSRSCFPLYLEAGLILDLPYDLKDMACFKPIAKILPLYLRVHTSILTELYLLKNKTKSLKCHKFTSEVKTNTTFQKIIDYNVKNNLCKTVKNDLFTFTEYTLSLSDSIVKDLFGPLSKESELEHNVLQLLGSKSSVQLTTEGNNLLVQDQPVSLTVVRKNNIVHITIFAETSLLLGLKLAISELLLNNQNKYSTEATNCVGIPAKILRKCEDLSKELTKMYGRNVNEQNFLENAFQVYCKFRKEISEKLLF